MLTSRSSGIRVCLPSKAFFSRESLVFSSDLECGCHKVGFFPDHRRYHRRDFDGGHRSYFQLTVLPFGLSSGPVIFARLLKSLQTQSFISLVMLWRRIPTLKLLNPTDFFSAGDRVQEAYEIGLSVPLSVTCEITQPRPYGDAFQARITSLSSL